MPVTPARPRRVLALVLLAVAVVVASLLQAVVAAVPAGAAASLPPGQARLVSRFVSPVSPTEAQYQALVRLENTANANIRALHGMDDSPESHDRVVYYDRSELRAALYGELVDAVDNDHRSPDEQLGVDWLTATAQAHDIAVAEAAQAEYRRWFANLCTSYHPPTPYEDEWHGYEENAGYCSSYRSLIDLGPNTPTLEQFNRWGSAKVDYGTLLDDQANADSDFTAAAGIALGSGAAAATGVAVAATMAQTFGGNALLTAVLPYAVRVTNVAIQAGIEGATAWLDLIAASSIFAVAGIVLIALTTAIMAGLKVFAATELPGKLQEAVDDAHANPPNVRDTLATTEGQSQVYRDFVRATPSVCKATLTYPGNPNVQEDPDCVPAPPPVGVPAARNTDPLLQVLSADGSTVLAAGTSVPFRTSLTVGGTADLSLRQGWFSLGAQAVDQPLPSLGYTDWSGNIRVARVIVQDGRPTFRSVKGAADAPGGGAACGTDPNGYCVSSRDLQVKYPDGTKVIVRQLPSTNDAPTAPVFVNAGGYVDETQALYASLPPGAVADPNGDPVTQLWTVELDYPCDPANNAGWVFIGMDYHNCRASRPYVPPGPFGSPNDQGPLGGPGPHGGWVYTLAPGDNTVVWHTPGNYRVTLTITDSLGASTSISQDIPVAAARPRAPMITAGALNGGNPLDSSMQTGIGGTIDVGNPASAGDSVVVNWGDGSAPQSYGATTFGTLIDFDGTVRNWSAVHYYAGTRTYQVSLQYLRNGAQYSAFTIPLDAVAQNHPPKAAGTATFVASYGRYNYGGSGFLTRGATDPDGDQVMVRLTQPTEHGTVSVDPDGTFRYTPDVGYWGHDQFKYQTYDPHGSYDQSYFTQLQDIQVAPPTVEDRYTLDNVDSSGLTVDAAHGVLANDPATTSTIATRSVLLKTGPQHGTVTLDPSGAFVYHPAVGYAGPDTFSYVARSVTGQVFVPGSGSTNVGADSDVTRVVIGITAPATAVADTYSTPYATPLTVAAPGLRANDVDPSPAAGGSSVTDLDLTGTAGTVHVDPSGAFTFDPFDGFHGITGFSYRLANASAVHSAPTTVTITVGPPVLTVADRYTLPTLAQPLTGATVGVLANDTGQPHTQLTAALATPAQHGTVSLRPDGSFTYRAQGKYVGPDSFTYTTTDGSYTSPPTTVSLTIVEASADLQVTTSGPVRVDAGSTFQVRVKVTNNGPSTVSMMSVALTAASGLAITSIPGGSTTPTGTAGGFAVPRLLSGQSVVVKVTVRVTPAGRGLRSITTGVSALAMPDPDAANNSSVTTVRILK